MGRVRIEPEEPTKQATCGMCGGTSRLLHGYVYDDERPHGIYFLEWCDGPHPRRAAFITVGLGRFDEDSAPDDRRAFSIEWQGGGMSLMQQPARDRPELLGPFVPRDQALALPSIDHVWRVADHIVADDPRTHAVEEWLAHS